MKNEFTTNIKMTTRVENIKSTEYPISREKLELYEKLGLSEMVPRGTPVGLTFELHDTTTALVNAFRRCSNTDIPVSLLDVEETDIKSDDPFIVPHWLRNEIRSINIKQIETGTFHINEYNNTDEIISVYSGAIKDNKNPDNVICWHTIKIADLRPGCSLHVNNIRIAIGNAAADAFYSFSGRVCFAQLSDNSYKITIPRQTWFDPLRIVELTINTLEAMITKAHDIINENKTDTVTSEVSISFIPGQATYRFENQSYTLGNILVEYCQIADKKITNVHCIRHHPSYTYIEVGLRHAEPREVLLSATALIKKELATIKSALFT